MWMTKSIQVRVHHAVGGLIQLSRLDYGTVVALVLHDHVICFFILKLGDKCMYSSCKKESRCSMLSH